MSKFVLMHQITVTKILFFAQITECYPLIQKNFKIDIDFVKSM